MAAAAGTGGGGGGVNSAALEVDVAVVTAEVTAATKDSTAKIPTLRIEPRTCPVRVLHRKDKDAVHYQLMV